MPVLAPSLWPKPRFKSRRAITLSEHQCILAAEKNTERYLYYQLLWEVGSSQSDAAKMNAEDVDRLTRILTYFRIKTGEQARMAVSKNLRAILEQLPTTGPLFPNIAKTSANVPDAVKFKFLEMT